MGENPHPLIKSFERTGTGLKVNPSDGNEVAEIINNEAFRKYPRP